ncbi:MAG: Rieske 2Fe-2S domain-containing protein [Gemmataceae bacterium]|nr:Rieske 2Fe-2S domain-containing protein [Gemmataceae bacterium]
MTHVVSDSAVTQAPPAEAFPTYPVSWYLFGDARELRNGPVTKELLGRSIVGFRTATGRLGVMDARCSHLRANLGNGCVIGETIQCPYHHWRYGVTGRCVHIPHVEEVPAFARQRSYPVVERHGLVFFFNGPEPLFPLPFFADAEPAEFVRARPFGLVLDCPWWMVGANACDLQHFLGAHDRKLCGPAHVETPSPYARHASAPFAVVGHSLRDDFTRWFGGNVVTLSIADWCGTLMFVTARFRRTCSYGMLTSLPLGRDRVFVRGIVFVRRSRNAIGRQLIDPIHLRVRRFFIKEFLRPDAELATRGLLYRPESLLACDEEMARYFAWLAKASANAVGAGAGAAWTAG